ncbi:MAG: hypothetical protein JNM56_40575 [Planctomycetia bacterium]|nr:hypothetical protein [Planctomycetia bacterium]
MSAKVKDAAWVDSNLFNENRSKFPADELLCLVGQWAAWNLDGTALLAHAEDLVELDRKLKQLGIDPAQVVHECLPPELQLGGLLDCSPCEAALCLPPDPTNHT